MEKSNTMDSLDRVLDSPSLESIDSLDEIFESGSLPGEDPPAIRQRFDSIDKTDKTEGEEQEEGVALNSLDPSNDNTDVEENEKSDPPPVNSSTASPCIEKGTPETTCMSVGTNSILSTDSASGRKLNSPRELWPKETMSNNPYSGVEEQKSINDDDDGELSVGDDEDNKEGNNNNDLDSVFSSDDKENDKFLLHPRKLKKHKRKKKESKSTLNSLTSINGSEFSDVDDSVDGFDEEDTLVATLKWTFGFSSGLCCVDMKDV